MKAAFFDTETSGFPNWHEPSEHPSQPHIVQIGACLVDTDTRKTLATLDVICKPEGWTIPVEASAVHGITTEMAMDVGVPESLAVEMLLDLVGDRMRIAHNETFDQRIVRIAIKRFFTEAQADAWKAGRTQCTQNLSSPILKLPPTAKMKAARRFHNKSPNLGEAHQFFTGKPLENAHSALVDVHACMAVWFGIQDFKANAAVAA